MWDSLSSNCRLALARFQCSQVYVPCQSGALPAIYPLLHPASVCAAVSSACTLPSDVFGVSITLSGSTTATNTVSPVCASPGSPTDTLASSLSSFLSIVSVPTSLYGSCQTFTGSACASVLGSEVYVGAGISQAAVENTISPYSSYLATCPAALSVFCNALLPPCNRQAIASQFGISSSVVRAALPAPPCQTSCTNAPSCATTAFLLIGLSCFQTSSYGFDCSSQSSIGNRPTFPSITASFQALPKSALYGGLTVGNPVSVACSDLSTSPPTLAPSSVSPTSSTPTMAPVTTAPLA